MKTAARYENAGSKTSARLSGGYRAVLQCVRVSIRAGKHHDAESLLMTASDLGHEDAAYFNLLGALHEAQQRWRLARRFYGKAIAADRRYDPAQQNMRRMYELDTFGAAKQAVCLGDEI